MSFDSMQESLCNTLEEKFGPAFSTVKNARSGFRNTVAEFSAEMRAKRNLILDPQDILQEVTNLQAQTQAILPGSELEDMEQLKHFIAGCEFFSDVNPVGLILGGTAGVFNQIGGFIDNLALTVPQIGLGKLADAINDVIAGIHFPGGSNIAGLLQQLDKLLHCAADTGLCDQKPWISDGIQAVDDLYTDFNIIDVESSPDYGKFDFTSVYNNAGLNPTQIQSMFNLTNGITDIKSGALSSITSSANAAKSLIKSGGFF